MTDNTRKLKLIKPEAMEAARTVVTVITTDGEEPLERAAFMLHTATVFNLKRYYGVECLENDFGWAGLTWREIKNNPAHRWIYDWFLRTAEDFHAYITTR